MSYELYAESRNGAGHQGHNQGSLFRVIGLSIDSYEEKIEVFRKQYPANPMTISGLELALFRAYLRSKGIWNMITGEANPQR